MTGSTATTTTTTTLDFVRMEKKKDKGLVLTSYHQSDKGPVLLHAASDRSICLENTRVQAAQGFGMRSDVEVSDVPRGPLSLDMSDRWHALPLEVERKKGTGGWGGQILR